MDLEAKKLQLESEQRGIQEYLSHPVTKKFFADVDEQIGVETMLVSDIPVTSIEGFFRREQAIGSLRSLRGLKAAVHESLDEIKKQLEEIRTL